VSSDGKQLGIMPMREGLRLAFERESDLVEVAPGANPPVCRIMDYGKYKYEQSKREKKARKKQKTINVKELRMSPKIEEHDFDVKTRAARRFLEDGDKVKVSIRFRGREIVHADLARDKLNDMAQQLKDVGKVEKNPTMEGRSLIMYLGPISE